MAFTAVLRFGLSSALLDAGANSRLEAVGRRTSGVEAAGGYRGTRAKENPPQESPGRALVVFKIFSLSPR